MELKIATPVAGGETLFAALDALYNPIQAVHLIPIGATIAIGNALSQTVLLTAKVQYTFEGQVDLNSIFIKGNGTDTVGVVIL